MCDSGVSYINRHQLLLIFIVYEAAGLSAGWSDRKILAGQEWADEIDTHLNTVRIILLLISPDFVASKYCYGVEVKRAMERHD
jgi:hypothetical protein